MEARLFPVRCYTCNAVLAQHLGTFEESRIEHATLTPFFRAHHIDRMCCRRMFLGYVDIATEQLSHGAEDVHLAPSLVLHRTVTMTRTVSCD